MTRSRIWKVHLDQPDDELRWWRSLSAAERERAVRFACPTQQRRYAVAHAALRAILGRACQVPATQLRFRTEPGGRPYLALPGQSVPPDFNLSHAGEWALVAVAPPRWRIGVDIEQIRSDLDYLTMAKHLYHRTELERLLEVEQALRRIEYFRLWSAKEAYVKAVGAGLAGFRDVLVRHDDDSLSGTVLSLSAPDAVWPVRWLDVAPGYAAAVLTVPNATGRLIVPGREGNHRPDLAA